MARLMLNDELWSKLRGIMLQHRIYDKPTLHLIVEAMLYRMRVGCPWQDLPAEFGCWNSTYIDAARRETCFKNGCRQWKINLIEELNPEWRDLCEEICS